MGDDQNQEGWINRSFHPGAKSTYSSPGEPDVHGQGRTVEGIDEDQGAGGRTQGYTRGLYGGNRRTSGEE